MNDSARIESKLVGAERTKQRRTELLVDLSKAFAAGGPQAATHEMTERMGNLVDAFADQLHELKKQL